MKRAAAGLPRSGSFRRASRRPAAAPLGLAAACLLLGAGMGVAQTPVPDAEAIRRLEALVAERTEARGLAAVSVAIGVGGELVWADGFGLADLENRVLATPSTRYRTASISKWMTATAAMALVEEGKLDLDQPVQAYCPRYPAKQWPLTSRHLLTHRGGVRHYVGSNGERPQTRAEGEELAKRRREERARYLVRFPDVDRAIDGFMDDPLLFEPGTRYRYSSHGYRLLGCVLEGAAGAPYSELLQARVLEPAGMVHTLPDDAWAIIPERARGYFRYRDGRLRNDSYRDVSENLPAGGHLSTPADLVRFAFAFDSGRLVSEASVELMTARPRFANAPDAPDSGRYYGFGVNVTTWQGRRTLLHSGGQSGTSTLLVLFPDEEVAVAVMTNVSGQGQFVSELLFDIAERILGDPGD